MKKSQILAALALAFALGVVAPVASVVNTASVSAYSDETGTATLSDVNNSIAFVENNATYKAFVKILAANSAYVAGKANHTIADLAGDGTYATDAASIYNLLNTNKATFGYNVAALAADVAKTANYKSQIEIYVNGARTSALYNAFETMLKVLDNNKATDSQLVNAATALRTTVGWSDGTSTVGLGLLTKVQYDNLHPEEAKLVNYRGAGNPYSGWSVYEAAEDIYDAVSTAEEDLVKFNNGYNLYMPLIVESGLFNKTTVDALNANPNLQPSDLNDKATTTDTTYGIIRRAQWQALYNEVQQAKEDRVQENSGDNYSIIGDLAATWKSATGNEEAIKTVMARMAAYKAPVNPGTGDGTNKPDDDKKDPNAPDTGILADGEANASTTVAMVAGIATALTAAGAGVVAYRNARRSTRK